MSFLRLTRIDDLLRPDFAYLREDDSCFFLGDYTVRQGFRYSPINDLIFNLKKSPAYRGSPAWAYKRQAIQRCAEAFVRAVPGRWLSTTTFVPIPPSRAQDDPLYDDRIVRVLAAMETCAERSLDRRELIAQRTSYQAAHTREDRPSPQQLRANYWLRRDLLEPPPTSITLVDDVINTGSHFRAASDLLTERWPTSPRFGLFVARTVRVEAAE